MKKLNYLVSLILVCLTLNSCVTKNFLWVPKIDEDEAIKDLLINSDGSELIVIGKKYHYFVSDEKKMVKKILSWDGKEKLETRIGLGARGLEAEVEISLQASIKKLSKKQIEFMKSLDGKECDRKWDEHYENRIPTSICLPRMTFAGTRQTSNKPLLQDQISDFVSTGLIKTAQDAAIFEDSTSSQTFGKILLTPFAVAADIVLAPVYLVTVITIGIFNHHSTPVSDSHKK